MNFDYDVIIAGAGPAGTSAAICCARHGLRTLLLERSVFPRHRPGETLHPGTMALFEQLNVNEEVLNTRFIRHTGIQVNWGNSSNFVPFGKDSDGPWQGLNILRSELDSILLHRALASGAAILQPCAVRQPVFSHTRVTGVRCDQGQITARFTIDATGAKHWLATTGEFPLHRYSRNLVATYGYCRGNHACIKSPVIDGTPAGWTWIAPIETDLYTWTRLLFKGVDLRVPETIAGFSPVSLVRGADVSWRCLDHAAGEGFFVAGDAASIIDPASSVGVLKALLSGMYAADLIIQVMEKKIAEQAAIMKYGLWGKNFFLQKTRQLARSYMQLFTSSRVSNSGLGSE